MNGTVIVSCDAVGDGQLGPRPASFLIAAEQVVPAAGVEPGGVLAQLVQDLVHLERGEDRLDQDGRPDRAARDPERRLGVDEDVVPEPRLGVALELGQVEVRPAPATERLGAVVEQVQPEVEQAGRHRRAVDEHAATRPGASRAAGRAASRSARRAGTPCPRASRRRARAAPRRSAPPGRRRRWPRSATARPRGRP